MIFLCYANKICFKCYQIKSWNFLIANVFKIWFLDSLQNYLEQGFLNDV